MSAREKFSVHFLNVIYVPLENFSFPLHKKRYQIFSHFKKNHENIHVHRKIYLKKNSKEN